MENNSEICNNGRPKTNLCTVLWNGNKYFNVWFYLFGLFLRGLFLFLEQTIKADIKTNAIIEGIAQNIILNGSSTLDIQPSI